MVEAEEKGSDAITSYWNREGETVTDFEKLKNSYVQTIQLAIVSGVSHDEAKQGNELLFRFCKQLIQCSSCQKQDRDEMSRQIGLVKQTLELEIEKVYQK